MKFSFVVHDSGVKPLVFIDHVPLAVVNFTYAWCTKTTPVDSVANICIVDGYLEGETNLRRFLFDVLKGEVKEEPLRSYK